MTTAERALVARLASQEPGELLTLLAGCLAPVVAQPVAPATFASDDRRPGDDPYLIDEQEFSFRARHMSRAEQDVLRCRVNAARANKGGRADLARRFRQRADRLERKLSFT